MEIQHFFDPNTWTLTYAVHDEESRQGVVIDPVLDFTPRNGRTRTESSETVVRHIDAQRLTIPYVLETHTHADHLSGTRFFRQQYGAKTIIGAQITQVQQPMTINLVNAQCNSRAQWWTTIGADKRIAVQLAPAERDLVLTEMRQMLTSVHGFINAAARGDQKAMEHAARDSGMAMAADVNPMLMAKLPLEFKQLEMSVHGDFDKLAAALASGVDQITALRDLSNITARCVACHAAYRLP